MNGIPVWTVYQYERYTGGKPNLHGGLLDLLDLEGVDDPDGEVADQQEGHHLPTRLRPVLQGDQSYMALCF